MEIADPHSEESEHAMAFDVATALAAMARDGYAVLPQVVSAATVDALVEFVEAAVVSAGGEYVHFKDSDAFGEVLARAWPEESQVDRVIRGVFAAGVGRPAPAGRPFRVLRCISGLSGANRSLNFHFDSYALTAVVPVMIPSDSPGDLLLMPNARPLRRWYVANLLDQILVSNRIAQSYFRRKWRSRPEEFVHLRPVPGNVYLFWGYRALHANEPCHPSRTRATVLLHYGNVHEHSAIARVVRSR
ncbi:MAG: hypothetical protein ACK40J_06740 [Rhodococcus sp. (in: high G+C Gram-positive bacteria)]